jgi:hypothetical protein
MVQSFSASHAIALNNHEGATMKHLMSIMTLSLAVFSNSAFAANAACDASAKEKKLAGAALTSFMKKCEADAAGGAGACEAQAAEKKLAGAAKTSFVTKCEKDAGGGAAMKAADKCDAQAAEKKLAGAAKTSFTKKCVADAGG